MRITKLKIQNELGELAAFACLLLLAPALTGAEPPPLVNAHAHNDYEHARPLLDALEHGFCSVEADVWLVGGELLVAHNRASVRTGRTLQKLYLDPLRTRVKAGGGRVFPGGPALTLLIDVKSDATNTWLVLRDVLRGYESILTRFRSERTETNAVTVIISGNRARGAMQADTNRLAAYDGRLEDLESGAFASFIPLVSDNWRQLSKWSGQGPLPPADESKLREAVARAHAQGRRLRFWGAPDTPAVWTAFRAAGVDLLNADDLPGLKEFLLRP